MGRPRLFNHLLVFSVFSVCVWSRAGLASFELPHHSFSAPLSSEAALEDWFLTAASVPQEGGVTLVPSVSDRFGVLFHKSALTTSNFEVVVDLSVTGQEGAPKDGVFAFWYVSANASKEIADLIDLKLKKPKQDLGQILVEGGRGLFGMPSVFSGVGMVFSGDNVKLVGNDGKRSVLLSEEVKGKPFNFRNKPFQVKLRIKGSRAEAGIRYQGHSVWSDLGVLDNIPTGGFFGFTAYTGKSDKADRVIVKSVHAVSFDLEKAGETVNNIMLKNAEALLSHDSPTKTVKKATNVLMEFIRDTKPRDEALLATVADLGKRITSLESSLDQMRLEVRYVFGNDGEKNHDLQGLMKELGNLKSILATEDEHQNTLIDLTTKAKNQDREQVSEALRKTGAELEEAVKATSFMATSILVVFVIIAVIVGFYLYRKVSSYEKKHYL